jgi:sugar/nucleoside kinase (ribokinase family)
VTEEATGRRTFFHARGANALWDGRTEFQKNESPHFLSRLSALARCLDNPMRKVRHQAARLLAAAQEAGLKTSVDVVSEDSDRFARIVVPALKYVDYCILNEIEAGKTTGLSSVSRTAHWTR